MHWLRHLLGLPWDRGEIARRLRPLHFRMATEADFPTCERLHVENEAFGVPTNHRPFYARALRERTALTLMAEEDGEVVGTCGLGWMAPGYLMLSYGLVAPARQRTGVGTTMFVARVALLPTGQRDVTVVINALETSLPYYCQFGFELVGHDRGEDGNRYPVATMRGVGSRLITSYRQLLINAGAVVPSVTNRIPAPPAAAGAQVESARSD